jgi:hypothetical protein
LIESNILLTDEYVKEKYLNEYSKIHYITPKENKKVMKFQKTKENFLDYDQAYNKAGIKLIKINSEILKHLKSGNTEIIKDLK